MSRNGQSGKILNNQKGFTLIELVIVIVILGILAVVAVPRYIDMRDQAADAAANGVFGGAEAATATNLAAGVLGISPHTLITNGTSLIGAMDGTPEGWAVSGNAITATINATPYTITVATPETATSKAVLTNNW